MAIAVWGIGSVITHIATKKRSSVGVESKQLCKYMFSISIKAYFAEHKDVSTNLVIIAKTAATTATTTVESIKFLSESP